MPVVSLPHTFVDGPGNIASGEEVMDNFEAITAVLNGNVDSDNIEQASQLTMHSVRFTAGTDGVASNGDLYYRAAGGDHYFISTVGAWGTCHAAAYTVESDQAVKSSIKPVDGALDSLKKMRGVSFKRKGSKRQEVGVVAQEVEKAVPEAVVTLDVDGRERKHVDVMALVGTLIAAVNDLSAKVAKLEGK